MAPQGASKAHVVLQRSMWPLNGHVTPYRAILDCMVRHAPNGPSQVCSEAMELTTPADLGYILAHLELV